MPTPLTGWGRITITYTCSGVEHQHRMYVANPTLSGGQYIIDKRPDVGGTANWGLAADDLAAAMSYTLGTGTTAGGAVLDIFDGVLWNPTDTEAVAFPNLNAGIIAAQQLTATFRDEAFHHIKPTIMEGNEGAPAHSSSVTGGSASLDSFLAEFTPAFGLTNAPYLYCTSVWGEFIREDGFVAYTTTFKRVVRKARNLA